MARKSFSVRLDGKEYKLRLTRDGQRNLRERYGEPPLDTLMSAGNDTERLCAVLTEALNWKGNENAITDGEEFYDLLVDCGYAGQVRFFDLCADIAATSGLLTPDWAKQVKDATAREVNRAYDRIFGGNGGAENESAETEENPTTAQPGA